MTLSEMGLLLIITCQQVDQLPAEPRAETCTDRTEQLAQARNKQQGGAAVVEAGWIAVMLPPDPRKAGKRRTARNVRSSRTLTWL